MRIIKVLAISTLVTTSNAGPIAYRICQAGCCRRRHGLLRGRGRCLGSYRSSFSSYNSASLQQDFWGVPGSMLDRCYDPLLLIPRPESHLI
ncbi:hypothetical protein J3F84DRAFT_355492 [Trichoderma pleuroticola]